MAAIMEFEIVPTRSNKPRKCHSCGHIVPARAQSIKHTKRVRGTIGAGTKYSSNVTFYTCMECVGKEAVSQ